MEFDKSALHNLDDPNHCNKILRSYDELNTSVKRNIEYFDELIRTNEKGYSKNEILEKAQKYFPIVSKSYNKILLSFQKLFKEDNLDYNDIKARLSSLLLEECRKRKTGANRSNNKFLESIGIEPSLGGDFTAREMNIFTNAFSLLTTCRQMMAKLTTVYAICGDYDEEDYEIEGETEEGFQY